MHYIITSHSVDLEPIDVTRLGGKAAALASLSTQNLPIPNWFVVVPQAFEDSLTDGQRSQLQMGDVSVLASLQPNAQVLDELAIALKILVDADELVAVRSSAIDEDGAEHSFAGQLESFLAVPINEVAARLVDVWKSGFSDRLLTYRRERGLDRLPSPPAVLIQRMVYAEAAGVAFSANPITGQRGISVVSAIRGLGAALVAGETDADTYEVDRAGTITRRHTVSTPAVLTDLQVLEIAQLSRQVEACCGRPQDIEWAIAADTLYLLQSRPITAIAQLPDPDGVLSIWDNSNIAESYSGVTTPLTFSFARSAYEAVYRQFCRLMGVSEVAIARHDSTFRCMIGLVQGRIYYNLLNWYRVLALLPGFTVNRRFMEQMMGVREEMPADVLQSLAGSGWRDKVRDGLHLATTLVGLVGNAVTLPRQIRQFYQRLDRALSLPPEKLTQMRPDELTAYYHDLERQLLTRWDAPLVNDFFAMIFYGLLRKLTSSWCGDADGTLQNDLISGEGGMISAEPARRVGQMADLIRNDRSFVSLLCEGNLPSILRQMPSYPAFQQEYLNYLEKFGDRCLEELKLESTTLHDDPLLLLRSIGRLAQSEPRKPEKDSLSPRQQAEARVAKFLNYNPLRWGIFQWVLQNARSRVRDRENLRFERTRVFGRVRRIILELGKRLHSLDQLHHPRDIFYLTLDEALGVVDGTIASTNLNGIVALRQQEFDHYRTLAAPPDRFNTFGAVHPLIPILSSVPDAAVTHDLQGIGCCPGVVRAPVQVITSPKTAQLQPGHILVAERTDPGWIMLFPGAAGLLVERGSLLSHSAIVAREMGIPAIVSIPGVTQALKDGDWVEMNGSTGKIRKL